MINSVTKAYEAYPLTDVNKYNLEINSKRLGYQQGYEQCLKDMFEQFQAYFDENFHTRNEGAKHFVVSNYETDVEKIVQNIQKITEVC